MLDAQWQPYLDYLEMQGRGYAHGGVEFASWFTLVTAMRREVGPRIRSAYAHDDEAIASAFMGLGAVMDIGMAAIGRAYLDEKTRIISDQQDAIQELSTPVLQLEDRVLILPIVGVVDTFRARHLTEQLLNRIRDTRALVIVIDVTGVAGVDTRVVNHLIQAMQAATLMGATSVLTGVSPEVAQTLVALGVDLGPLATSTDLQGGVEIARHTVQRIRAGDVSGAARAPSDGTSG